MTPDQLRRLEDEVEALRHTMSEGERALEALRRYYAARQMPPRWVLREIVSAYTNFRDGLPLSAFRSDVRKAPAPRTLDEAFGIAPQKGRQMHAKRLHALMAPDLDYLFFSGPDPLPRSEGGYAKAADRLGITANQAREMVEELRALHDGKS